MTPIRPVILPDEIAHGYKGRILRLNGWRDEKEAMQALLEWSGYRGATRRQVPTVEILAKVAGVEVKQFVRDHTMIPLRRAVLPYAMDVPHGSTQQGSVLWTLALRDIRPGAYFCCRCVDEDHAFHGTPYWRREHQLPGLYWCTKHGCPLSHVESTNAFSSSPADFIGEHKLVDEHWIQVLQNSEPVQKFLTILSDLLASRQPMDEKIISRRARARATEMGLHTGRGLVHKRLLSDLLKSEYDEAWLDSVVPELADQPTGHYWHPVDGAALGKRAGVSAVVYALAFAVMYKSADDSTNAMLHAAVAESTLRASRTALDQVDYGLLRQEYIAKNGSHTEVAVSAQVNRFAMTRRLAHFGLPALGQIKPTKVRDVINLVLTGDMTLTDACDANEVPLAAIEVILRGGLMPLTTAIDEIKSEPKRKGRHDMTRRKPAPPPTQHPSAELKLALVATNS